MSDSAELLSDKTLKRLGTIFIELYVEEIEKYLETTKRKRVQTQRVSAKAKSARLNDH